MQSAGLLSLASKFTGHLCFHTLTACIQREGEADGHNSEYDPGHRVLVWSPRKLLLLTHKRENLCRDTETNKIIITHRHMRRRRRRHSVSDALLTYACSSSHAMIYIHTHASAGMCASFHMHMQTYRHTYPGLLLNEGAIRRGGCVLW